MCATSYAVAYAVLMSPISICACCFSSSACSMPPCASRRLILKPSTANRIGCPHVRNDRRNQRLIAAPPDRAPAPQPRKDRQRRCDLDRTGLRFGVQLVGLNRPDIQPSLTNDLFLHRFGILPRFALSIRRAALIQIKGRDNRRNWAAIRQQAQGKQHHPEWMFAPMEHSAGRLRKCRRTAMTDVAPFFERVDTNSGACATIGDRAYYQLWAHRGCGVCGHTSQ